MIDAGYLFENYHDRERQWLSQRVHEYSDIDDILGAAYMKATQYMAEGVPVDYPSTWFRSVVRHCWIDLLRYRTRLKRPDEHCLPLDDEGNDEALVVVNPVERMSDILDARRELSVILMSADLTDTERHVLHRRLAGDGYAELAADLSCSEIAVRIIYSRAVQSLRVTAGANGHG